MPLAHAGGSEAKYGIRDYSAGAPGAAGYLTENSYHAPLSARPYPLTAAQNVLYAAGVVTARCSRSGDVSPRAERLREATSVFMIPEAEPAKAMIEF